jgi:hypothetical protein
LTSDEAEELKAFLRDNVSGFEELETLLFFVRAPRRAWTCADVAAPLKASEELVEGALKSLTQMVVIAEEKGPSSYRYAPPAGLEPLLERLLKAYDEQRLTVVQMMTANAIERVRSSAAHRLADAFRVRGRKR